MKQNNQKWEEDLEKLMGYNFSDWTVTYDARLYNKMVDFIQSLLTDFAREMIGEETINDFWMRKLNVPSSDYSYGHMKGYNIKRQELIKIAKKWEVKI